MLCLCICVCVYVYTRAWWHKLLDVWQIVFQDVIRWSHHGIERSHWCLAKVEICCSSGLTSVSTSVHHDSGLAWKLCIICGQESHITVATCLESIHLLETIQCQLTPGLIRIMKNNNTNKYMCFWYDWLSLNNHWTSAADGEQMLVFFWDILKPHFLSHTGLLIPILIS